jgi:hypothetical protein
MATRETPIRAVTWHYRVFEEQPGEWRWQKIDDGEVVEESSSYPDRAAARAAATNEAGTARVVDHV